jgi:hypothetical protein
VEGEVKSTGNTKPRLGKDRDTIVQELHAGLRKLSLSAPSLSVLTVRAEAPNSGLHTTPTDVVVEASVQ